MVKKSLHRLVLSAVLLAIGLILPLFTAQIKEIGDTLLPMHIPVFLCGLFCGPLYGFSVGLLLPFLRSLIFGMPPVYPNAVWMALELATYGLTIGIFYLCFKKQNLLNLYICLVSSMLCGRVVWGVAKALLLGVADKPFTIEMFITGGFLDAIPGIILQLVLIPLIVSVIEKQIAKNAK